MLFHVATVKSSSVSESASGQLLEAALYATSKGCEAGRTAEARTAEAERTVAGTTVAAKRRPVRAKRLPRRSRSAPRELRPVPMEALHSVVCVSNEASDDIMNDG